MPDELAQSNSSRRLSPLRVCRIGRAQGLHGEVHVAVFTDEPERRFAPGAVLIDGHGHTFRVTGSRTFKRRWIVHFAGVADRTAAEALAGVTLYVKPDATDGGNNRSDAWYPAELLGLHAVLVDDNALGLPAATPLGIVSDVLPGAAQSLLEITTADGHKSLIPFVRAIVPDVDLEHHTLRLDPPPGLIAGL